MVAFEDELLTLLNRFSQENESNTPDYILRDYLLDCLHAYNRALQIREKWYGREITNATTTFKSRI